MIPASGSRFPQLDDPTWWALHGSKSDTDIAVMLGCHRDTVRSARRRQGVPSHPRGRRRGMSPPAPPAVIVRSEGIDPSSTAGRVLGRFERERRPGGPAATEDLLVARLRAAHNARAARDELGYDGELIAIASAAMLIHAHRQQLRKAA